MNKMVLVGWRLATMLATALALISLTIRWKAIAWKSVFESAALQYQNLTAPLIALLQNIAPLPVPPQSIDIAVLYVLFGNAMALSNMASEGATEGRIEHSASPRILLFCTFLWPYLIVWGFRRAFDDAVQWAPNRAVAAVSAAGGTIVFLALLGFAALVQSAIFLVALATNYIL
jgi:hypothetical protein